MGAEPYKNPYDLQISQQNLGADERQLEQDKGLFENQDMVKIIKTYLEENIPEDVKKTQLFIDFWAVFGKKLQLTFLEDEDKYEFEALFEQAKMAYLASIPVQDCNFNTLSGMKQLEIYFASALRSAVGTKHNKFNERIVQASTITQNIRSNTEQFGQMGGNKGGMFGWISKMF